MASDWEKEWQIQHDACYRRVAIVKKRQLLEKTCSVHLTETQLFAGFVFVLLTKAGLNMRVAGFGKNPR